MGNIYLQTLAYFLFGVGNLFVLSSMWVLGVTGTYLGRRKGADRNRAIAVRIVGLGKGERTVHTKQLPNVNPPL
jgi:hypothetical protein